MMREREREKSKSVKVKKQIITKKKEE